MISTEDIIKALEQCFDKDHKFVTTYDSKTGEVVEITTQMIVDALKRGNNNTETRYRQHETINNDR